MKPKYKLGQKIRFKKRSLDNFFDGSITGVESKSTEFLDQIGKRTSHIYQIYDGLDYYWIGQTQMEEP